MRSADNRELVLARFLGVTLLVGAVLVLRKPGAFLELHLWAEDGVVFFKEQLVHGLRHALFLPHAGYIEPLPRVLAAAAALFPMRAAPFVYALSSLVVSAVACAWFSRPEYRRILPEDHLRVAACLTLAAVPTAWEIIGNLANLHSYLLLLGYLLIVVPPPREAFGRAWFVIVWIAIGFAGPGALLLWPVWLVRLVLWPDRGERLIAMTCLAPAVITALTFDSRTRPPLADGGLTVAGVAKLVLWRVLAGPFVGEVFGAGAARAGMVVPLLGLLALCGATAIILVYGSARQRAWLGLTGLALATVVGGTVAGRPGLLQSVATQPLRWGGGRYFWLPVGLLVLVFFVALSVARGTRRGLVIPVLAAVLATTAAGFQLQVRPLNAKGWYRNVARLRHAIHTRESCTLNIPIDPPGWTIRVDIIDGRPAPDDGAPDAPCVMPEQRRRAAGAQG